MQKALSKSHFHWIQVTEIKSKVLQLLNLEKLSEPDDDHSDIDPCFHLLNTSVGCCAEYLMHSSLTVQPDSKLGCPSHLIIIQSYKLEAMKD